MKILEIKDLRVEVEGKEIIKGLNLELEKGKVYALMGPNGSGKTTLSSVLMGHPKYNITSGKILFEGKDISQLAANERAKLGLFLSFQYPKEVPGVTISNFLRTAHNEIKENKLSILEFHKLVEEKAKLLKIKPDLIRRYLNEGFSGGEKKRMEILQMSVLDPKLSILDETDSGLDIDALRAVALGVNACINKKKTFLVITHYKRILEHIKPDVVFIMIDGKIVQKGGRDLIDKLESQGYDWLEEK